MSRWGVCQDWCVVRIAGRFAKPQARCGSLPGKRSRASILMSSRSTRVTLSCETEASSADGVFVRVTRIPRFRGEPVLSGGRVGGGSFVGGFRVGRLVVWLVKPVAVGRIFIALSSRDCLAESVTCLPLASSLHTTSLPMSAWICALPLAGLFVAALGDWHADLHPGLPATVSWARS